MSDTINAGHCVGTDPGAIGPAGLQEADVNLAIAKKICNLLTESQLIMDNDLQSICDAANDTGTDLFVSIHCNAAENPDAKGTETYYYENSTQGEMLAQCIHDELVGLGLTDRGTKTAGYYVLKHTDMPAVLVEVAFISNPDEEQLLANDDFQQQVADAIVKGINQFKTTL